MTHTIEQPGLHAHSWDPEHDLLKQFMVQKRIEQDKGWLGVVSFSDYGDAFDYIHAHSEKYPNSDLGVPGTDLAIYDGTYRVWDQFRDESWTFDDSQYR